LAFLGETCSPVHFVGDSDDSDHGMKNWLPFHAASHHA